MISSQLPRGVDKLCGAGQARTADALGLLVGKQRCGVGRRARALAAVAGSCLWGLVAHAGGDDTDGWCMLTAVWCVGGGHSEGVDLCTFRRARESELTSAHVAETMSSDAPPVQVFVEPLKGEPQAEAPQPTTYCCWRCQSSVCCCGRCARPCTPRLKRWTIALVVFCVLAGLAGAGCGIYFGVFYHPGRMVHITSVKGTGLSTATPTLSAGRKLLQAQSGLTPASAVQSSTECAYAQARVPTVKPGSASDLARPPPAAALSLRMRSHGPPTRRWMPSP